MKRNNKKNRRYYFSTGPIQHWEFFDRVFYIQSLYLNSETLGLFKTPVSADLGSTLCENLGAILIGNSNTTRKTLTNHTPCNK